MLNKKDPYMLLSIVNMKLRDEGDSLEALCQTYDKDIDELKQQLKRIGYDYDEKYRQFIQS